MQNVVWNSTTDPTEKENVLSKQEKRISSLRLGIIKSFENAFSDTKDAFLERRNETLSMYAQERSMRESIAEKHNVLRMKQIKPLRDELERFKSMVTKEP